MTFADPHDDSAPSMPEPGRDSVDVVLRSWTQDVMDALRRISA